MSISPKDPLLTAGKIMTVMLMVITGLVFAMLVLLVPFLLYHNADFAKTVAEAGGEFVPALTISLILIACVAAIVALAFYFFRLLGQIIDTVGRGNPFSIQNADRLSRMGAIALIFQLSAIPIAAMAVHLEKFFPAERLTIDFDFSLTGILLAIVLFILARIFRLGAAMREDLEGTV